MWSLSGAFNFCIYEWVNDGDVVVFEVSIDSLTNGVEYGGGGIWVTLIDGVVENLTLFGAVSDRSGWRSKGLQELHFLVKVIHNLLLYILIYISER